VVVGITDAGQGFEERKMKMPKKLKLDHAYHAGKDKMKITVQGCSPSKNARDAIMKNLTEQLEGSADRLVADVETDSKTAPGKKLRGQQKYLSSSRSATEGKEKLRIWFSEQY
jgi:hypothetical protein